MKRKLVFLVIALIVVAAIVVVVIATRKKTLENIKTTGIVEGTEVNLSPKVAGRISYLCCDEGGIVKEGEVAVRLESADLSAAVEQAVAGVEKAQKEVDVSRSAVDSARANVKSAEADIKAAQSAQEKARVTAELAKKELDRSSALHEQGIISKDSFDVAVKSYDASSADYASSESRLAAAESGRDAALAQLSSSENKLKSSEAGLKQAEASLAYAQAKLADTVIASPITGTVVFKSLEKGEIVSPGMTILTIVNLQDLYVRVDIDETLVGDVILNGKVIIRTEGNQRKTFEGKISEIGRYAEFATQKDVTRGRQDIKTFRVKIKVGDTSGTLKPGMTVGVEIPRKQ